MANNFELPKNVDLAGKVIESQAKQETMKIEAGWLGAFFGNGSNVGLYIVGLISLILLITATVYTFIPDDYKSKSLPTEKLWNIVLPVITTIIGYIFGFNNGTKSLPENPPQQ